VKETKRKEKEEEGKGEEGPHISPARRPW